ncbi:MAG: hypothetical protein ACOH5I_16955 [Oligoflexus sp.]
MNGYNKLESDKRATNSNSREYIISRLMFAHELALRSLTLRDEILRPELIRVTDHSQDSEISH